MVAATASVSLYSLLDGTSPVNQLAIAVATHMGQQLDSFGGVMEGFSEAVTFELDLEV